MSIEFFSTGGTTCSHSIIVTPFSAKDFSIIYEACGNNIYSVVIGFIMKMAFLFEIPIMAVLYVWCQLNKSKFPNCYYISDESYGV